ncbi:MAG: molybdopterin-dependent oxidoreductase [Proteobacteria bacterium]|nr:molybdopterin-dependent oxidoreductase [Pseudomonadota bacterium]
MPIINRRDFLKFIGAGSVGTGAGVLYGEVTKETVELLIPQVIPPEDYSPGIATWYNTVCRQCSAGCGISVRTREGRAKKIEGNPVHPVNQGRLCAMGQAGLNALYNPDRIRGPLKRNAPRGSLIPISWDEALTNLGRRLGNLKIQGKSEQLTLLSEGMRGHQDKLFATFMRAVGSENYLQYDFAHPTALYEANKILFDIDSLPYYDIKNTNYLLSFGADYLGTWLSPVHYSLAYGHLRQGRGNQRGKCVQIEPRMSLTGASADEWIAAKPGTEGLLAMSMAYVIVNEGHYPGPDLDAWVNAVASYAPKDISSQTGIAATVITRLAHEFINHQPGLAIGGGSAASGTNAVSTLLAINALNYLVGNLNQTGGVIFNPGPAISHDGQKNQINYSALLELRDAMTSGSVDTLIIHNTNPVFTLPSASNFKEALEKVPFKISLSSFMDETTALADLVLPTHTYLEAWGDDIPEPGIGFSTASLSQPVVTPIYDTRASGDIILSLAHQIGGELPVVLPWTTMEDYLKASWKEIYEEHVADSSFMSFDAFWRKALESGVWGENKTVAIMNDVQLQAYQIQSISVEAPAFAGNNKTYPFVLLPYLSQAFFDGKGANLPWMQEMPDPMTSIVYGSWVELNPATAKKMDIVEGDVLEIQSTAGSIQAPAFIFPAIRPDVVAMPIGQGHTDYGRYAKDRGTNPLQILAPQIDDKSSALAWSSTRIKLTKTGKHINIIKTDGVTRTLGRQIFDKPAGHS